MRFALCGSRRLLEGDGVQAVAGAGAEGVAGRGGQPDFVVAKAAQRAHRAEAVAPLPALEADQARLDLTGGALGAGGKVLLAEARPPVAADRLHVARRRGEVRAAVERIDALVVAEADLGEHLLGAGGLRAHLADGVLDLLGEQGGVDLARREQLLDELLVLPREPVRLLVGEAGELAPQRFPERAAPVLLELGEQLDQHAVAETGGVHRDVEEADVAELLAGLVRPAPVAGVHHQAADLGRAVEVVADREHAVAEVPVHVCAVVLLLVNVEEDVRRVPGAVLRDDQRRPHHPLRARILEHEDVLALEGVLHPRVERSRRPVDDAEQLALFVGQVHRVQLARQLLQRRQVALLDVADHVHAVPMKSVAPPDPAAARSTAPGGSARIPRSRAPVAPSRSARWACARSRWSARARSPPPGIPCARIPRPRCWSAWRGGSGRGPSATGRARSTRPAPRPRPATCRRRSASPRRAGTARLRRGRAPTPGPCPRRRAAARPGRAPAGGARRGSRAPPRARRPPRRPPRLPIRARSARRPRRAGRSARPRAGAGPARGRATGPPALPRSSPPATGSAGAGRREGSAPRPAPDPPSLAARAPRARSSPGPDRKSTRL